MEPVLFCYMSVDLCQTAGSRHKRQQYFASIIRVNDGAVRFQNRWFSLSIVGVTIPLWLIVLVAVQVFAAL